MFPSRQLIYAQTNGHFELKIIFVTAFLRPFNKDDIKSILKNAAFNIFRSEATL